jgi:hypothetical protein
MDGKPAGEGKLLTLEEVGEILNGESFSFSTFSKITTASQSYSWGFVYTRPPAHFIDTNIIQSPST